MKNNKILRVVAWILVVFGVFDIFDLIFKLSVGQGVYINDDIVGIIFLILGVAILYRFKKK